jgi:hypothetical protein
MKKILLSTLAVSALAISATAQAFIPNPGFESWGQAAGEDQQPSSWISYNIFTTPLIDLTNTNPTSVTQAGSPDNYQGNYSAKVQTVTLITNPSPTDVPYTAGVLYSGVVSLASPYLFPGYASTQRPASLSFYAKYAPVNTDTAWSLVTVTHWNGAGRDTIATGYTFIPSAVASYTQQTVTMNYNPTFAGTFPDTISIVFSASSLYAPQVGSALWLDAVAFSGYVGVDETILDNGVSVYPNPSATVTQFDVTVDNAKQVVVYDMTGREVRRENFFGKSARVNSAELADGAYTYTIVNDEQNIMSRGQFSVAH